MERVISYSLDLYDVGEPPDPKVMEKALEEFLERQPCVCAERPMVMIDRKAD